MAGTKNSGEKAPLLHPSASDSDVDVDVDVPLTTMTNEGRVPSNKRSAKNENDDMIGFSGLITPSIDEIVHVAREM